MPQMMPMFWFVLMVMMLVFFVFMSVSFGSFFSFFSRSLELKSGSFSSLKTYKFW